MYELCRFYIFNLSFSIYPHAPENIDILITCVYNWLSG